MKLFFETRTLDNVLVLDCKGRFAYRDEARAFSEMVGELLPRTSQIVIELSNVEMIDSAGLGELVVVHMWARASGCVLKLAGANDHILRLFDLTNLSSVFDTCPTLADAIQALSDHRGKSRTASHAA